MNKKMKRLLILSLVMVLLIGAFYIISSLPETEEVTEAEEIIELLSITYSDINALTISQESGTFKVERIDDQWVQVDTDMLEVLSQRNINKSIRYLIDLSALSIIEEQAPEELSPYGLDQASIISLEMGLETDVTIRVGDVTARGSYYLMIDGDKRLYEIDEESGNYLSQSYNAYLDKVLFMPVVSEGLSHLTIERRNNHLIEMSSITDYTDGAGVYSTAVYRLSAPYNEPREVNSDRTEYLFEAINSLSLAYEVIPGAANNLAIYGLDRYEVMVSLADTEGGVILYIGDEVVHQPNLRYCMVEGRGSVYLVDGSYFDYLKELDAYELIFHFVMLVNIDSVEAVEIKRDNKEYILDIDSQALNQKKLGETDFKTLYQSLIGISTDSPADEITSFADAEITITYLGVDGGEDVVSFTSYNDLFYAAYANEVYQFVVAKETVETILSEMDALLLD